MQVVCATVSSLGLVLGLWIGLGLVLGLDKVGDGCQKMPLACNGPVPRTSGEVKTSTPILTTTTPV